MVGEELLERALSEVPTLEAARGQEGVVSQLAEALVRLEPDTRGDSKPMLGLGEDRRREEIAERPLEQVALLQSTHLVLRRQEAGELHQR